MFIKKNFIATLTLRDTMDWKITVIDRVRRREGY